MQSLRDIKRKIGAVKKTQQITKAMYMVASAKLRGAQTAVEQFRPYASKFGEVLSSLAGRVEPDIHPLLVQAEEVKTVALILITADRGLCGSYNSGLIMTAEKWIKERKKEGKQVVLYCIGRKGRDFFRRRGLDISRELVDQMGKFDYNVAREISQASIEYFLSGECQEIYVLSSEFIHVAVQRPALSRLLPISPKEMIGEEQEPEKEGRDKTEEDIAGKMDYICEPSAEELLIELLPRNVEVQIFGILLEAVAAEYAARMNAMDNAQSNCKDMIDNLTLAFNKARQSEITLELIDIVGGAEALKK